MIIDSEKLVSLEAYTGSGTNITSRQIDAALTTICERKSEDKLFSCAVSRADSVRHLMRCWCDQRKGVSHDIAESDQHQQAMHKLASGLSEEIVHELWFMGFEIYVIGAMQRIYELASSEGSQEELQHSPIEDLRERRNEELATFEPAIVEAVYKLRKAAILLGMPENYFISRPRSNGLGKVRTMGITDNGLHLSPQLTEPPLIERYPEFIIEEDAHKQARESMAAVAEILDGYQKELRFAGRRGKQTFECWAVRNIWSGIEDAFRFLQSPPVIKHPWATIRDLLALCNVDVSAEMIRKTINTKG